MKNQFVGDINDFHKYGLLHILTGKGKFRTGVCWMRRPDESSAGGYLNRPGWWQKYDPPLFRSLRGELSPERSIRQAEHLEVLPRKRFLFFRNYISDGKVERERYFDRMLEKFQDVKLIFFDPDTGLEVKSTPSGRKGSSKYLYGAEVCRAFHSGKSLLIYQHFPPKRRELVIAEKRKELAKHTGGTEVYAFRTPRVIFFLAVQPKHSEFFQRRIEEVERSSWHGNKQILVCHDKSERG